MTKIEKLLDEIRSIGIWNIEQQMTIGTLNKIIDPTSDEIKLLTNWRKNNQQVFRDDHRITIAGTVKWWHKHMAGNKHRILFWVDDTDGNHIGHMGLAKFTPSYCHLDNVVRGRKESPGIMHFAVESLIDWAFSNLKIKNMYLQTQFDNDHAIEFYEFLSFARYKNDKPLITMKYHGLWTKLK